MKGWYKDWVIYTKFLEDDKDELIILLLNFTQLQLEHQVLEFGEETIQSLEVSYMKRLVHSLADRSSGHLSYQTR